MRKIVLVLVLGVFLSCGHAFGFWVGDVADSPDNFTAIGAQTFDWSSSGAGVAVGLGPFGTPIDDGTNFEFLFQSSLVGLTGADGQPVLFGGGLDLNADFEYTVVAKVDETKFATESTYSLTRDVFTFTDYFLTTGGSFSIYYDDNVNATYSDGTGFDDGTLVASGSIIANQISSFSVETGTGPTYTLLDEGIGSFIFDGVVDYANGAFLDPTMLGLEDFIIGFRAEGTLNYPPLESESSAFFAGGSSTDYPTYTVLEDDLSFKVDASSKFTVVPEPSTFLLLGSGLLGVFCLYRRKS